MEFVKEDVRHDEGDEEEGMRQHEPSTVTARQMNDVSEDDGQAEAEVRKLPQEGRRHGDHERQHSDQLRHRQLDSKPVGEAQMLEGALLALVESEVERAREHQRRNDSGADPVDDLVSLHGGTGRARYGNVHAPWTGQPVGS